MFHKILAATVAFGPWGVFLLGILDSVGVPVPGGMDFLVVLVAWKNPQRAYFTAFLAVAGSMIGNVSLFQISRQGGRRFLRMPQPGRPQRFRAWFHRYGLVTVFIPALLPIPLPLKVFVISAGVFHTRFSEFLAVVLVARLIRYFGEAYLGVRLGRDAQLFLTHNGWTLTGIGLGLTFALVLLIKLSDRRRYPKTAPGGDGR